MKIISALLEINPNPAMRAIETPLRSSMEYNMRAFAIDTFQLRPKRDMLFSRHPWLWLERLPTGSISTWEDLTTRFLAQFFSSGRTAKLRNDILVFQQHQGESLSKAWTRFKDLLQKVPHHGIDLCSKSKSFYDHVNPGTRRTIDQSAGGKLRDINAKESWALLEDLALYDKESWNDPRDFAIPVKAISLPHYFSVPESFNLLAHAPIYNAIMYKYVESLELGKNGSAFIQDEMAAKIEDLRLFTLPCKLGDSKPFDTLSDLGSCVNIIPLYLFKKLKIGLLEETGHVFGLVDGTKSYPIGIVRDVEVHIGKLKLLNDFYVIDMKKDPKTSLLVGRGFLATANTMIDCRKSK
ncbi:MAK10-like protein [Tanacetum coccineum]